MHSYSTRQRKVLLAYLSQHPDELLSARQIADALADKKNQPERRISKPCTVRDRGKSASEQ